MTRKRRSASAKKEPRYQKLSVIWATSREYSGDASTHVRTSALAGVAITWLFSGRSGSAGIPDLSEAPTLLLVSAGLFAASLSLDILHYYISSIAWRCLALAHEDRGKSGEEEVRLPDRVPGVGWFLYHFKVLALFGGFIVLTVAFVRAAT